MKLSTFKPAIFAAFLVPILAAPAAAQIVVSEVFATGNTNTTYKADWFELTNTGSAAVDITGWKMDDDSNSFASAVALRGLTSIAAGQSVVFIEGGATNAGDAALNTSFRAAWGSASSSALIANYGGTAVGLGANGDQVNIFNSGGTQVARVLFGVSTAGVSFDNRAGLNNATLTQLSVAGVNGAYASTSGSELGSPGSIASVPEADGYLMALAGMGVLCVVARRRKTSQQG